MKEASGSVVSSKSSARSVWSEFLKDVAQRFEGAAVVFKREHSVAWKEGDCINHLQLVRLNQAGPKTPGAPPITRACLNMYDFYPSKKTARQLGILPGVRFGGGMPRLEFSMLNDELGAFAEWIPAWGRGVLSLHDPLPLPPFRSLIFGKDLRSTNYAWTVGAWEADARWYGHDEPPAPRGAFLSETPA